MPPPGCGGVGSLYVIIRFPLTIEPHGEFNELWSRRGREMASAILPFSPADAHIRGCPARTTWTVHRRPGRDGYGTHAIGIPLSAPSSRAWLAAGPNKLAGPGD